MRFAAGELLPLKGVWFKVKEATAEHLVLEPVGFTKKALATSPALRTRVAAILAKGLSDKSVEKTGA